MNSYRILGWLTMLCVMPLGLLAQEPSPVEMATVDANTRWAFRTVSPVTLSTSIVRLRDVAVPLDPNMAGWQRLSGSVIGLVPVGGAKMVIEREKLERAIRGAEATPSAIDWIGPSRIEVSYRKDAHPHRNTPPVTSMRPASGSHLSQGHATPVSTVSHQSTSGPAVTAGGVSAAAPVSPALSAAAISSITSLIRQGITRQYPSVVEEFEFEIDPRQAELAKLKSMRTQPQIEFLKETAEPASLIRVTGKNFDGPCESVIRVSLRAHPKVVFPTTSFQRGHRLGIHDLETKSIPANKLDPSHVTDPNELIGKEVRRSIRAGVPVRRTDVGSPILIRRGDLVDIRVIQGAITVSTTGKAIQEGAEFDTIEVEKSGTRKRLLARVVQSGLVEIVTRAPQVGR